MIQAYTVLTEFKFEVGNAIVGSEKVQSAVDGISNSADRALNSLKGLGLTFVANFGLGASSVIGVLGQALKASDNFYKSQLVFSNIISSNIQNLTGDIDTFNSRMGVSSQILKDIAKDAKEFGLPEQSLANMTKLLSGALTPKGLQGENMSEARIMSRNLLKSAPVLGVDPMEVQGQLLRAMQGGASGGDPLFRSLSVETEIFKQKFGGDVTKSVKLFNKLPLKERFDLLNKGLGQFAKDSDVLAGNAQTLGAMMQRLRDMFIGFTGILKPLGDVIILPLRASFEVLMGYLDNQGRRSVEAFSGILKFFISDIESSAATLMQARRLGQDFKASVQTITFGILIHFLAQMGVLGYILKALLLPLGLVTRAFSFILPYLPLLGRALMFVAGAVVKFSVALLPIWAFMQMISRAAAIGRINDLKRMPEIITGVMEQFRRFANLFMVVFGPALKVFDQLASGMSWFFEFSFWLQLLPDLLKMITDSFVFLFATIRGAIFSLAQVFQNLSKGNLFGAFSGVGDKFKEGFDDFYDQLGAYTKNEDGSVKVASNITNIDKIEINNQFKEQMEPDRIAFTLRDQLLKAATNPLQASGRSSRGMALGN